MGPKPGFPNRRPPRVDQQPVHSKDLVCSADANSYMPPQNEGAQVFTGRAQKAELFLSSPRMTANRRRRSHA